jgi:hypothetical protein
LAFPGNSAEVRRTVNTDEEMDEELHELLRVLTGG